jgi:tRNA(Ile)-lysidine synthase
LLTPARKPVERFQAMGNPVRVKKTLQGKKLEAFFPSIGLEKAAEPILEQKLDAEALFAGCEGLSGLLLAVSGGPDSLALMHLAAQWRAQGAAPPLFVATVDHGLRENSGAEARRVGEWARALALPHEILCWRGPKPARAILERARDARYALLFAHSEKIGAAAVATGHHADDQWETILFRLARGSGVGGLAGMAREQRFPGGLLIRPLLRLPKQALIDFCREWGQEFFDDPSNAHPAYARTKWRRLAPGLHDLGLTPQKAARLGARAKKADEAVEWTAENLLRRAALGEPDAYDLGEIAEAPRAVAERFLSLALARVAGSKPQRLDRLEFLAQHVHEALQQGSRLRATLGGCAVTLDARKVLILRREGPRRRGIEARR